MSVGDVAGRRNTSHIFRGYEAVEWKKEACLCRLVDDLRDAVLIIDPTGKILYANRKYLEFIGFENSSLLGRKVQDLVDQGIMSLGSDMTALTSQAPFSAVQVFKTDIVVYSSSTPVFNERGELSYIVTQSVESRTLQQLNGMKKSKRGSTGHKSQSISEIQRELNLDEKEHVAFDKKTISIYMMANRIASVDAPVLLHGPRGGGKENVARYIHKNSKRANQRFMHIYTNSLVEDTADQELFGYEDDTGKHIDGLLDKVDGGTAYIDEIIGMPIRVQSKLLTLIHSGVALSATGRKRNLNIRFVFGSLKDEQRLFADNTVKREWYYILSVFSIYISPLKERKDDIIPLLNNFLSVFNAQYHTSKKFERSVYDRLLMYDWPGNHRELKILVNRAIIISKGEYISLQDLFLDSSMRFSQDEMKEVPFKINLKAEIEKLEAEYMTQAFNQYKNTRAAAKSLGIDSSTFVRKRQNYIKKGLMQDSQNLLFHEN